MFSLGGVGGVGIDLAAGRTLINDGSIAGGVGGYGGRYFTVTRAGGTLAALHFSGSYTRADFWLGTDNRGGTFITRT